MTREMADTHYLCDFLDANEAMDVNHDCNDLDLRPPAWEKSKTTTKVNPDGTYAISERELASMIGG